MQCFNEKKANFAFEFEVVAGHKQQPSHPQIERQTDLGTWNISSHKIGRKSEIKRAHFLKCQRTLKCDMIIA